MFETRSTVKWYDEENHILQRASQCPQKRLIGNLLFLVSFMQMQQLLNSLYLLGNRVNYPLKLYPQCPANNENRLVSNKYSLLVQQVLTLHYSTGIET